MAIYVSLMRYWHMLQGFCAWFAALTENFVFVSFFADLIDFVHKSKLYFDNRQRKELESVRSYPSRGQDGISEMRY